jgi:hypothetical protein
VVAQIGLKKDDPRHQLQSNSTTAASSTATMSTALELDAGQVLFAIYEDALSHLHHTDADRK